MSKKTVSKKDLAELMSLLEEHPELYDGVRDVVSVVQKPENANKSFDQMEDQLIPKIRDLGKQALGSWVARQEERSAEQLRSEKPKVQQREKKR